MANVNKVVDRNGNVVIDISTDTVKPTDVISGKKFHGADGKEYIGSLQPNELDSLKYTFIDYDGEVMYTFTDAEIDAMTELPAGPDHTDDNLTFQEWNWSLEDLKAWDRTRPDRPIVGATLITTDGKTYIEFDITRANTSISLYFRTNPYTIDWGDGTTTTNNGSHTYSTVGKYTAILDFNEDNCFYFGTSNVSTGSASVTAIQMGHYFGFNYNSFAGCIRLEKINLPKCNINNTYTDSTSLFYNDYSIKAIVLPRYDKYNDLSSLAYGCKSLKFLSLPNFKSAVRLASAFYDTGDFKLSLPENISSLYSSFQNSAIRDIVIPAH